MIKKCVSINILNYNTFEKTKKCIDSCLKQKGVTYQILLIDNNSSDDSLNQLYDIYGDTISYLKNIDNFGYAKGNNLGVAYSKDNGYTYSLLLNSDTELSGDFLLKSLVDIIESYRDCAIVAPTIYNVTNRGNILHHNDSIYHKLLRFARILPHKKFLSNKIESISEAYGSAMLVDNKCFLSLGGFPEHYFMYGEESTFAKKTLWSHKLILWSIDNDNFVLHHHDTTKKMENWRNFLRGRNRGLEFYENYKDHNPLLWSLVYKIYGIISWIRGYKTGDYTYYEGLKRAKILSDSNQSNYEKFLEAKKVREEFKT